MDSRVVHSHVQDENDEPQQVILDAEENHSSDHEKKSVLNKVKAKAKKIKDTIKKHGQQVLDHGNGHNNEIQHTPDDDGDLDEDKEVVQDPQIHQVPSYDSEDVKSATPTPASEQDENLGNSGINFEGTKVKGEESYHDPLVEGVSSTTEINRNIATDQVKTFAVDEKPEQYKANLERPIVLEEDSKEQGSRTEAYTLPNYQTKDTDPSGAESDERKDITPLEESLERMNVHDDEPKPTTEPNIQPSVTDTEYPPAAGSHDQLIPHFSDATKTENEYPHETLSKDINRNQEILEEGSQDKGSRTEAYTLPNYQSKDIDPSEEGRGERKETTPLEESLERMNVHDESKPITEQKLQPPVSDSTEYPSAGSHDIDHFVPHLSDATETQNEYPQETVSEDINRNQEIPSETRETFNTITNTVEKQPEEADKTLPPENDEASRLGNDEKGEQQKSENGKNTGYSLTEKLAPVYGKVAEVGSAVKSKVYGTNDGTETKNGDKGVTVKDYLAEKLKPSEEDKALSEVISETLNKGKEDKKEDGKLDSEVEKPEKVFEESNVTSPGKGMVDKVKDAVGSWFVKSPQGGGIGEDLSKNKNSVGEVEQVGQVKDEGGKQE